MDRLGGGFSVSRSDHFVLFHDIELDGAREFLRRMEATYDRVRHFCHTYGLHAKPLSRRLEAACVTEAGLFEKRRLPKTAFAAGVYDPVTRRSYFDFSWRRVSGRGTWLCGNVVAGIKEGERITVQHETAHQVLDHFCPVLSANMPAWLSEGLGCAFEPDPDAGVEAYRLLNARRAEDFLRPARASAAAPGDGETPHPPTGDAVNMTDMLMRGTPPPRSAPGDLGDMIRLGRWYGASWAGVFYFQRRQPDAFKRLLHALSAPAPFGRDDVSRVVRRALGPFDDGLEQRVVRHVQAALAARVAP